MVHLSSLLQTVRYQVLISLMLSSQTKDQVTFAAMEMLFYYFHLSLFHLQNGVDWLISSIKPSESPPPLL